MPRRPPSSTLFPYTTLFRALCARGSQLAGGRRSQWAGGAPLEALRVTAVRFFATIFGAPMRTGPEEVTLRAVLLDWDGTLLDSYHADTQAYLEMFQELGIGWGVAELARHHWPDGIRVDPPGGATRKRL